MRRRAFNSGTAQAVAVQALTFLSEDPEQLEGFLAATGLRPDTLRAAAGQPEFWAGLLDHLACDDALLIRFAQDAGLSPEDVMAARQVLSPVAD